jgi:hypothetical protein
MTIYDYLILGAVIILIVGVGFVMLNIQNIEVYNYLKQDCESNNGTLWTYSNCQNVPFTKSNCEFVGGYVCHLPNGTKYQRELTYLQSLR